MENKIISINKKSFISLLLCLIMLFSVFAPTISASVQDNESAEIEEQRAKLEKEKVAYETEKGITGKVIDFSSLDFSAKTKYGDLNNDNYEIEKQGKNYIITFKNLTAKKVILPPDDADKNGKEVVDTNGEKYNVPAYTGKKRENNIIIKLEGKNAITGYGMEGYPVKGVKIEGSGDLTINAYSEPVIQKVNVKRGENWVKTVERVNYTKAGISIETGDDKFNSSNKSAYSDENSLVFAGTGSITINAPDYYGIINNGDIKFESGNVKIVSKRSAISGYGIYIEGKKDKNFGLELISQERAFFDKPTFQNSNYAIYASKSSNEENSNITTKQDVENSYTSYRYVCAKYITPEQNAPKVEGGTVENGKVYCGSPVVTVSDDTAIDTITVNGVKITSNFRLNTAKKKTFNLPTSNNAERKIVVRDIFGNETSVSITVYEFHKLSEAKRTSEKAATCTTDGYYINTYYCTICNTVVKTEKVTNKALWHKFVEQTDSNTKKRVCSICGYTETENLTKNISDATISVQTSKYTYDGSRKEPLVTVRDGNKILLQDRDYTVTYSNNISVGTANVKITGINNYKNTANKSFTIVKANNTITASNFTKNYSKQEQNFNIGAKQTGNAKLAYSSNNSQVVVDGNGKVTVKAGFTGKATITITANSTTEYNMVEKQITVTVLPAPSTNATPEATQKPSPTPVAQKKPATTQKPTPTPVAPKKSTTTQSSSANTQSNQPKVTKSNNSITASNFTKNASTKTQSFNIGAKQRGNAKLTYSSNNKNVTVDKNGKVTVKAGFSGKATITITANATSTYNKATKNITVTVNKVNNKITASNFTKTTSTKAQSFKIGTKQTGNAKLTYSSNNKNVTVDKNGKVTIKKGFVGKATITITASSTSVYNKATKKITITVNPQSVSISKLSNSSGKKMTIRWKKNTAVTGYEIQYSTDKNFKKNVKKVSVNKNSTVSKTITKLSKSKKYYVRIRSYKTVSRVKYYSSWSSVKNITIKK